AWAGIAAGVLTAALVVYELIVGTLRMDLVARNEYGAISYSNDDAPAGPPLMALVVVAVLLLAGIFTWVRMTWPWLAVVAGLMVVGTSIPWSLASGAITHLVAPGLLLGAGGTV